MRFEFEIASDDPYLKITTSAGVVARVPVAVRGWPNPVVDAPNLISFTIAGEIERVSGAAEQVQL